MRLPFGRRLSPRDPDAARIPAALQSDPSEKARRARMRMARNYAFDRARYFLPAAVATNVMLVMSARAWVSVCQHLLSHPLPEANALGEAVRGELGLATPRLLRHALALPTLQSGLADEFEATRALVAPGDAPLAEAAPTAHLDTLPPSGIADLNAAFARDLRHHNNRYAYIGETLRRTAVRFGWPCGGVGGIARSEPAPHRHQIQPACPGRLLPRRRPNPAHQRPGPLPRPRLHRAGGHKRRPRPLTLRRPDLYLPRPARHPVPV